jgi:nucleoside-diphosphate-sugar epimerase
VNGTEYFYKMPEFVLDVAIKGVMNVLDGCILHNVPELIMASSSEVYQNASTVPTDENVSLVVPDVFNPRYSYGGGKILSELVAVNYGKKHFNHVVIFRPHNVYGPDMGWEHVIPQFVLRMNDLCRATSGIVKFPIQGTGKETRAFVYIDDFTNGLMKVIEQGEHLNVYHIGTNEEVSIEQLAKEVAVRFEREIKILPGVPMKGSALRRCPDISKLRKLGYEPKVEIKDGLRLTTEWYIENSNLKP